MKSVNMIKSDGERGSAARLLLLLKLIAQHGEAFALKDLAGRAALPQATVHRLLQALVASGMVERGEGQSYRPGRELFRIGALMQARFDIAEAARPHLQALWERWRETCVFCLYSPARGAATVVEAVQSPHPLRFAIETGAEIGLPWGSLGRSILAQLDEEERRAVLERAGRSPVSGREIGPVETLKAELDQIRAQGHALYLDREHDLSGIAAPVFGGRSKVVGCLGVTMPSHRFSDDSAGQMAQTVMQAASDMSQAVRLSL